jgi:hypothetical protein
MVMGLSPRISNFVQSSKQKAESSGQSMTDLDQYLQKERFGTQPSKKARIAQRGPVHDMNKVEYSEIEVTQEEDFTHTRHRLQERSKSKQ